LPILNKKGKPMRGSVFWGSVLVVLGGLFLLDNLGLLPVRAWSLFWPLALIAAGALTLYGVMRRNVRRETTEAEVAVDGDARARVRVHHGAGILRVQAGAKPGMVASGSFAGGLVPRVRREGDLLVVDLSPQTDPVSFITPWNWEAGGAYDWNLNLTDSIPLELFFETGASESRIDLSGIRAASVSVTTGASSTFLTLPAKPVGTCSVRIEGGAASIEATVPAGVEAFVLSDSGLADVRVDRGRFLPVPGGYQSSGYVTATDRLEIRVSMGLASFRLG
jgi:hypothetical protein